MMPLASLTELFGGRPNLLDKLSFELSVADSFGDFVITGNGIDMAAVLLTTTCTAVAVPLNPNNSKAEIRSYFEDIGVTHLIVPGGSEDITSLIAGCKVHIDERYASTI